MKIAIIGTGIAGNVAAWHLNRDHDITVYEAQGHIGGHTHTHDLQIRGQRWAVDSGFIVFNHKTYPNFLKLLQQLRVGWKPTEMSFSVHCDRTGLEYCGTSLNTLFAQRSNLLRPSFYRMLRDILRFNRAALAFLEQPDTTLTLADFLRHNGFGAALRDQYIVPMGAAIWSADPAVMLQCPALFFLRFCDNHGLLSVDDRPQWFVIEGGSHRYVEKLTAPFRDRIRLDTPVTGVTRHPTHVSVTSQRGDSPPVEESFDAVFFACHSDQALTLLTDASGDERDILGAIPYQPNLAYLHTDSRFLPTRKLALASWNYRIPTSQQASCSVTYHMNTLQGLDAPVDLCVTLNPEQPPREQHILKTLHYAHPMFTARGVAAQARHEDISGVNRTFYCGAYWRYGFHEDGVWSALQALQHFTAWEQQHAQLSVRRTG